MEAKIVSGKLTVGDVAVHVECGFIPDEIQLIGPLGATATHYKWAKVLYDHAAAETGKFGYDITNDAPIPLDTSLLGFTPYDESEESVMLPAPDGDGFLKAASIADFNPDEASYTARGLAALGSVVRPTIHNGFVYECTNNVGTGAEPTWPTKVGDSVTIVGGDTWICREERVVRTGVQGFTIGETLCNTGDHWFFKAELHDRHNYMGDARVENPVTFRDHMR